MKHVVIGYGEVGKAIAAVLEDRFEVEVIDLFPYTGDWKADVIHICFPWSKDFNDNVRDYQALFGFPLTVIHSTVPVGTSSELNAVHSPVTGRHPNLEQSIRTFTKFFGGPMARVAAEDFATCGVHVFFTDKSETTEAGKLWQTLQYGYQIALQKEGYKFFKEVGADPRIAYEEFNNSYNFGYMMLGDDFNLVTIKDMPGKIGGHCVIPNLKLTPNRMATFLQYLNEDF